MSAPRTRIIATVGPACEDPEVLAAMVHAGATVFRINGSHTPAEAIRPWVERIHAAGEQAGRIVSALLDLPGTKIRTGTFRGADHVVLEQGQVVELFPGKAGGTATRIPIQSLPDLSSIPPDSPILMADGQLRLRASRAKGKALLCRVLEGGELGARKGVDFPGTTLPVRVPTRQDRALTKAGVEAGVDGLALSFVQDGSDVRRLRELLKRLKCPRLPVVSKIEREAAVSALEGVLQISNAVMVARGDLGTDVGPERVPSVQKRIIHMGRRMGRPVVVATEMLESMTSKVRPTRAEASDVAGAVFDGADAVMLSGESAVGRHPVLVVDTMARILHAAEADPNAPYAGAPNMVAPESRRGRSDQDVVHAGVALSQACDARALIVFTRTGASAIRCSKERPRAPIYAYTDDPRVGRRLTLGWGIRPRVLEVQEGTDAIIARVAERLEREEGLEKGDRAVLIMGGSEDPSGTTSLIKVVTV